MEDISASLFTIVGVIIGSILTYFLTERISKKSIKKNVLIEYRNNLLNLQIIFWNIYSVISRKGSISVKKIVIDKFDEEFTKTLRLNRIAFYDVREYFKNNKKLSQIINHLQYVIVSFNDLYTNWDEKIKIDIHYVEKLGKKIDEFDSSCHVLINYIIYNS